jgi:transposase-like protein
MKRKANYFTDELKFQVVQEYLDSDISKHDLMLKYKIGGSNCIANWMRKFDLQAPDLQKIELQSTMAKQTEKTSYERELESKVQKLEQQLEHEQFRTLALNTMIDIAERDLKISIRKKAGAKR